MDKRTPHILIVDDDPNFIGSMSDILRLKGFEPLAALTGDSALKSIEQHHINVALIDLRLGKISGLEVLRDIKARAPQIECILLTGYASENSAIEAIQLGAFGYFQKPFEMEQVLLSIQRAVEKQTAEAALHKSEERYRALTEQIPAIIYLEDAAIKGGHTLYISPQVETILGITPEEWMQDELEVWSNHIHPDDRGRVTTEYDLECFKKGMPFNCEYRMISSDNRIVWIRDEAKPLLDEQGKPYLIHGIMQDITERKRTEDALRQSEARFHALIQNTADLIVVIDAQGILQFASPSSERILGYTPQETLGRKFTEWVHPDDVPLALESLASRSQIPGTAENSIEVRILRKDGAWRVIEALGANLLAEPAIRGIVINMRDVTERKQAEDDGRRAEEKYRNIFENSLEGIFQSTPAGRFITVNPALARMWGYDSPEDMLARVTDIANQVYINSDVRTEHMRLLKEQGGNLSGFEYQAQRKDGSVIWVSENVRSVLSADGELHYYEGTVEDISTRKQAEEAVRESEVRYRSLFEDSPVPLWEEDFSAVKLRLDALREAGIKDFRAYFASHPQTVLECISLVKIVDVNRAALKLFGAKVKADLLQNLARIIGNDSAQSFQNELINVAQGKSHFEWEGVNQTLDGRQIVVRLNLSVIPGYEDSMSKVIISMVDITAHMRAEKTIRESERSLRESQMIAGLGSYMLDIPSEKWTSSDILNGIFGIDESYTRSAENSVESWTALVHPDWRQEMSDYFAKEVLGNHIPFDKEYKIVRRNDGAERWVHGLGKLEFNAQNQPVKMRGTIQDITERKQAEETLEQSARELQTLYETSMDVHSQTSLDTLLSSIVERAASLLGTTSGGLYLMEPHGQSLKLVVGHNLPKEFIGIELMLGEGLSGQVAQSGKPINVEDYQAWPDRADVYKNILFHRTLGVPLKVKDKVIGVLNISDYARTGLFSEDQVRLVSLFADQAALAIDHARLYEQEHSRRRELDTLYDSAMTISSNLSLEVVLKTVTEQMTKAINTDGCALSFWDHERDAVVTMVDFRLISPGGTDALGKIYSLKDYPATRRALETREPLLLSRNNPQIDQAELDLMNEQEMSMVLLLPLVVRDQVIGLMEVYEIENKERIFTADEMRLAHSLSVQTAIFIENARLYQSAQLELSERKRVDEAIQQRVAELELLYESGLAFSQLLNPKEIAQKIIHLLEQKMDWHHTAIRLYNPETKALQLLAFNQPDLISVEEFTVVEKQLKASVTRLGQGLSGWVIQHGQTVRSNDLADDERYFETLSGMLSGLYVPIKLGERVIGAISIESEQPNAFSEADERLTNTLASQAASALENARLFDETRQRIMELTALHRTGQTLLAARLNPEQIYAAVHQAVAQTMPCEAFVIVLEDEEHGEYHAVYFFDKGERFPMRRLPRDKGLSGRVISSGVTLLIGDINTENLQANHFGSMESVRSILAVPLRRGNEVVGMLSTQSYQPHAFGEPQRVMLETITAQLSSALDNAHLYQQTQARINELETLHIISTSLRTIQSIDEALSTLLDNTLAALGTDSGSILLYDPPSNELRDVVARGWFTELAAIPIKAGEGVAGTVFASGEPYYSAEFIRDALPHASTRERVPAGWGGVCLPIRTSTEIIGVLFVSVQQPRQINSQQIRLLESLVDMAGAAMHRMRLHNETARRAEQFVSLYETSKALSAEYDLDSLLGVIVTRTREMVNASTSGMYFYHAESQELELMMDTSPTLPIGTRLRLGEGVAGKVAQTRQPLRIEDYSTWEGRSPKYEAIPIHAVIEVPMLYAGELIGVLTADETGDSTRKFTEADERLLSLFASQAAGAINSARHRADTIRHAGELEQRVIERTAEIEATRQRLDLAASAGGIGVWEVNLKENKVLWDTRMYTIHGTDPAHFDNSFDTWWQMIYSEDLARSQEQFQDALQNTGVFSGEHRIVHSDGSMHYISSNAIVLYDGDHNPERMVGVNVDITERKRVEEALHLANLEMERAMRTKDEFLANMSHELRTPLNSILGISESLEEQIAGGLNEKQLKYIGIVRESGRHLLELINDILDLSKIEAGRMELDIHHISVEKFCQSSLRMVKELAQKKSLNVSYTVNGDVKIILGDERRLKQSLVNLLSNAVKFTPPGSRMGLEVNAHPETNEVSFTIWDQGIGIAQKDIQYLFKPFVQLDAGLAREYQGTGLGLALVAQMAHLHGGRVSVESEVGKGSRFTVTLPWSQKEQTPKAKVTAELSFPSPRSNEKRNGKILLVEDTDVVVALMNDYLRYKGYEVFIARDGMEGVLLAKKEKPDIILMDIMMPVMDGLEAARRIRADDTLRNTIIIALTALAMPGDRERCLAAGMNDYMSKPIQMQELAKTIESHLTARQEKTNGKQHIDR